MPEEGAGEAPESAIAHGTCADADVPKTSTTIVFPVAATGFSVVALVFPIGVLADGRRRGIG